MKKAHELPQAVSNLRAIWDRKKVEMKFTQVEAAVKLGWSQGAVSHYLNNITELGPAAVVKFANFLGVDPLDIDPEVIAHLPDTRALKITRNSSDFNKTIEETYYHTEYKTDFRITVDPGTLLYEMGYSSLGVDFTQHGETCIATLCEVWEAPRSSYFIIQKKGEREAHFYHYLSLPDVSKVESIYAVCEVFWLNNKDLRGPYK